MKLCHQRARKTEKEGRRKGREEGRNKSLTTKVAVFVFASHQDKRFIRGKGLKQKHLVLPEGKKLMSNVPFYSQRYW